MHLPKSEANEVASTIRDADALKKDLALNTIGKLPVNQWNNDGTALTNVWQTMVEQLGTRTFVNTTTNGGAKWVAGTLSADDLGSGTLSCSSASDCTAIADPAAAPVLIATSDDGMTWHTR